MKVTALMLALLVVVATATSKTPSLRRTERQLKAVVDLVESEEGLNDDQDDMIDTNNGWNVLDMGDTRDEETWLLRDDDSVSYDDENLDVILNDDSMADDDYVKAYDDDGDYGDDEYAEEDGTRT